MNDYREKLSLKQKIVRTLLRYGSILPDKQMISTQYALKYKRFIDWKDPKRFTEKLQWCKIYYRNPLMTTCADKYKVREYVKEKGWENILNELYGVFDNAEQINFEQLPDQFVVKVNNGSGTNLIVRDKEKFDPDMARTVLDEWVCRPVISFSREWQYKNIEPKIIVEKFLPLDESGDLCDYKFFCFDGKVFCLYVTKEYFSDHSKGKFSFYDRDFNKLPYTRRDYCEITENLTKPDNFEKMLEIAESLSAGFPHVRVDLYNIQGKIYFGELTFCTSNGYFQFEPDEFDFIMGDQFKLPEKRI